MSQSRNRPRHPSAVRARPLVLEVLEDRTLLSSSPAAGAIDLGGPSVNTASYSASNILVEFRAGAAATPALAGTAIGPRLGLVPNLYEVDLSGPVTVAQALAAYRADALVSDAEPDYTLTTSSVPNDPSFGQQWALQNTGQNGGTAGADIHATQAWDVTTGSSKIVLAVNDTGIDYNHPDLYENIWINQAEIPASRMKNLADVDHDGLISFRDLNNPVNQGAFKITDVNHDGRIDAGDILAPMVLNAQGQDTGQGGWAYPGNTQDGDTAHPNDFVGWNFVTNTNAPFDDNGHGTNVAGIIGATGNNGVGVAGVDWNAQLMSIKFLDANGNGTISSFIAGLQYAVNHGAQITNNSWEGASSSQVLLDAINNARSHGQIFVAAAGNEGTNNDVAPNYPSSYNLDNIVSVAATDRFDNLAGYSDYGAASVDLAAPGDSILSTANDGGYSSMSGTSQAAPQVSGVLALVWGLHPNWTYTQVINQVLQTTDKLASLQGKALTGGIVDAARAVGWSSAPALTPQVIASSTTGASANSFDTIHVTFNEAINPATVSIYDAGLIGPNGQAIPIGAVNVVPNTNNSQLTFTFAPQTATGNYLFRLGPTITDMAGAQMALFAGTYTLGSAQTVTTPPPSNTFSGPSATIPASGTVVSTLTVSQALTIGQISVQVNLSGPADGNLYIHLQAPDGTQVVLSNHRGGSGSGFQNTTFSSTATTPVASGAAPFSGTYLADGSLASLAGRNAQGPWRLWVENDGPGAGTLTGWSLNVTAPGSTSGTTTSTGTGPTSTPAPTAITFSGPSASIPASGTAVSTLTVGQALTIGQVGVKLNLTGPADGNLYIHLQAPDGTQVVLSNHRGGSGSGFQNTTFSSTATTPVASGAAPFTGTYLADGSLASLAGRNAQGPWRLWVENDGPGAGTLTGWSLIVTPPGGTSGTTTSTVTTTAPPSVPTVPPTTINAPSASIPASGTAVSTLTVGQALTIGQVGVKLNLTGPADGNLYIHLQAPDGTQVVLSNHRGGSGSGFQNTTFSSTATTPVASGAAPFSGTYLADGSLASLAGRNAQGPWRLWVENDGPGAGTLTGWSLIITPASVPHISSSAPHLASVSAATSTGVDQVFASDTAMNQIASEFGQS